MRRLRVVLADDHPSILSWLRTLLEVEYDVVGTAENGRSLVATVEAVRPDFIVSDIDMPVMDGIKAVREIHRMFPEVRVIFHSSHSEPEVIAEAFGVGASGYLVKGSSHSLVSSIRNLVYGVDQSRVCSQPDERQTCPPTGNGHRGLSRHSV
jgi:DNA-binding NarL/FixJ family response regulator